jgi:hypothetical protein
MRVPVSHISGVLPDKLSFENEKAFKATTKIIIL